MKNKIKKHLLISTLVVISSSAFAQGALGDFAASLFKSQPTSQPSSEPYVELPIPADNPKGKVVVNEFFSYGCPHCSDFSVKFHEWEAKQPNNVVVSRVPITFDRPQWVSLAKLYYTIQLTKNNQLDQSVFSTIHKENNYIFTDQQILEWAGRQKGVDIKKFTEVYNSKEVSDKVVEGDKLANKYFVTSVPNIVVNGHYKIQAKSFDELLVNTDQLIKKVGK